MYAKILIFNNDGKVVSESDRIAIKAERKALAKGGYWTPVSIGGWKQKVELSGDLPLRVTVGMLVEPGEFDMQQATTYARFVTAQLASQPKPQQNPKAINKAELAALLDKAVLDADVWREEAAKKIAISKVASRVAKRADFTADEDSDYRAYAVSNPNASEADLIKYSSELIASRPAA